MKPFVFLLDEGPDVSVWRMPLPLFVWMLPELMPPDTSGSGVVVFDVLRATTSMAAALAAGAREIRLFGSVEEVAGAARNNPEYLRCGEVRCLKPVGFDLGNSPSDFVPGISRGRTLLMSTTNGTRALLTVAGAQKTLIGALVNRSAVARLLAAEKQLSRVDLLCAGTNGSVAMEDLIGCGSVAAMLARWGIVEMANDSARIAMELFEYHQADLAGALSLTTGGLNVIAAGLAPDIAFASQLDALEVVGLALAEPVRIVPVAP